MATIINAVSGTGLTQSADGSGVIKLQSNGVNTNAQAWVNFTGSTGAVNASYNVSSVTRSGLGVYVINITTALSSSTPCCSLGGSAVIQTNSQAYGYYQISSVSSTSVTLTYPSTASDPSILCCSIFC